MPFHIWEKTSHVHPPKSLVIDKVVMTLMEPFMSKGRNVTTDNLFMLFLLAKELKKKKASLVETMNKVRLELPASAKCLQQRYSSKLMKTGDTAILTAYQCNPKKNVCVFSSLHMFVELGESEEKKPEKMEFYDKSKCGLDVADQMARQYSVKTGTHWWPIAVFYNILNLAGTNAFVLYKKKQVTRFQDEISCSSLLQNYVKTTLLKIKQKPYYC